MCGIGGLISFKGFKKKDLAIVSDVVENLLMGLEERGSDASGIALIDFKSMPLISKKPIKASTFIENSLPNKEEYLDKKVVLLHTRAATQGDKKFSKNNHPFHSKETNNTLIHNGVITNDGEVKIKFDLECDGDCDSEVILQALDKLGINKAIPELNGSMAIAYAKHKEKELILYKAKSPLYLAWLQDYEMFVFASTLEILDQAFAEFVDTEQYGLPLLMKVSIADYAHYPAEENEAIRFDFKTNTIDRFIVEIGKEPELVMSGKYKSYGGYDEKYKYPKSFWSW